MCIRDRRIPAPAAAPSSGSVGARCRHASARLLHRPGSWTAGSRERDRSIIDTTRKPRCGVRPRRNRPERPSPVCLAVPAAPPARDTVSGFAADITFRLSRARRDGCHGFLRRGRVYPMANPLSPMLWKQDCGNHGISRMKHRRDTMARGATTARTARAGDALAALFAVRIVGSHLYGVVFYNRGCQ